MDVEENYESQSQPQPGGDSNQELQQQQQQQQQQQMQCEPLFGLTTNTTTTTNPMMDTNNIAIPLPAPPGLGTTTPAIIMSTTTTTSATNINSGSSSSNINNLQQQQQQLQQKGVHFGGLPTNDYDIDSLLLQQFSCMGTTDHEDLISQFQNLMNNQMNRESARFYLEMSNWNLQTAVGCYLDFCSLQSLPSMKIVQGQHVNPQQQAFQLRNDGQERWPNGCYLTSPIQTQRINVPSLRPGETCDILADLMPTQPPIMWRLCTPNGGYFGDAIWMIPPGTEASQDELQQRMVQLITSDAKPEVYPQINIVITARTQ
ncbi:PAN2-PAN3 deadenylation complex subunit pan3 [Drosophila willistoni]|uniref:PAN2-PAN3 deadenylation complex subunit pan3 n=1 Tax=Drosophila willistoni TaxID=7260 RepID=UPI00017D8BD4|nr:PAN2-PAN3 deadenylation complex subunit pan3 [Drosophila willistoni]